MLASSELIDGVAPSYAASPAFAARCAALGMCEGTADAWAALHDRPARLLVLYFLTSTLKAAIFARTFVVTVHAGGHTWYTRYLAVAATSINAAIWIGVWRLGPGYAASRVGSVTLAAYVALAAAVIMPPFFLPPRLVPFRNRAKYMLAVAVRRPP
jgi:hypothetical protein